MKKNPLFQPNEIKNKNIQHACMLSCFNKLKFFGFQIKPQRNISEQNT
jgi:hypothetical protein